MNPTLACIVEGHGEVKAFPVLLRRLAQEENVFDLDIPMPIRCPRSKYIRKDAKGVHLEDSELKRVIALAVNKLPSIREGGILVLLDADESCPAELGPAIFRLANGLRPDVRIGVVLAKREYEAWFLAALESLAGKRNILDRTKIPSEPEEVSDAKGYLTSQMREGTRYSETVDQPALSSLFSLDEAESCDSFRKLRKEVRHLLDHLYPKPRNAP